MKNVSLFKHPLIDHSLTVLRDKTTETEEFRRHAAIVSKILLVEVTKNLKTSNRQVMTPLASHKGKKLVDDIVVVPVLRAGLAMLFALQDFLPAATVGFIGLERDEETAVAHEYYRKLPRLLATSKVIVLDPMLATGGSFCDTIEALEKKGATDISLVAIVSAPEGISRINNYYPNIHITTCAIDKKLNDKKFIVPGLGDFGDRYFGTL